MRFTETGVISDHFYATGASRAPIYLLDGPEPMLFDAGFTAYIHHYLDDIETILDGRPPTRLLLTHAHFDHIGAVAQLKRRWPELRVMASAKTRDILARPGAIKLISDLSREATRAIIEQWEEPDLYSGEFEPFTVDEVIEPGMRLSPGNGKTVEVIHTPGHTWDFLSFWITPDRILVGSESLGVEANSGRIQPEFMVDYDAYVTSLNVLRALKPRVICLGHLLNLSEEDAERHMDGVLTAAEAYLTLVEESLEESGGDIETAVQRIKTEQWDKERFPKQPEQPYLINTRQRVIAIKTRMQKQGRLQAGSS